MRERAKTAIRLCRRVDNRTNIAQHMRTDRVRADDAHPQPADRRGRRAMPIGAGADLHRRAPAAAVVRRFRRSVAWRFESIDLQNIALLSNRCSPN